MTTMDGSHLFRIQRTFALETGDASITAIASHATERRQLQALAISDADAASDDRASAHFLILRSVEEDRRVRHWRFPLAASRAKQDQHRVEPVSALAFSPEGDWLACLATRKSRLHLVPVATLIAGHRRAQLAHAYRPSHNREWMGVSPSVMTAPMASYLRATNEAGGLNGARYRSRVTGDDSQMSTLEFAAGMGTVTCCRWWRSMSGKTYCLVGGTDNLISIVNAQENAEECRCELQNAGAIQSIELFYETFRKEKRTSMLVKTHAREDKTGDAVVVKYFRVVLEKKTLQEAPPKPVDSNPPPVTTPPPSASSAASTFTSSFVPRPPAADVYVIKTFPEHFVEDVDFRPQRIKKHKPDVRLRAINGLLSSESGLALLDTTQRRVGVYSNFQWTLKGQYAVPPLADDAAVTDVDIAYCSSDLLLLQGTDARTQQSVATWISLPSRPGALDEDDADAAAAVQEAQVVHRLSLHGGERVETVLQSTTDGEVVYLLQTAHSVYECRPQWSRLALFRALSSQSLALREALSIGYALGIDMASLCEVVADTLVQGDGGHRHHQQQQWLQDLYLVSRAAPSKIVRQLASVGAPALAIAVGHQVLQRREADADERHAVAIQVVDLVFQLQLQHSFHADADDRLVLRPREPTLQATLEQHEAWLDSFLRSPQPAAFEPQHMIALCLRHAQLDKALAVAVSANSVGFALDRVIESGLAAVLTDADGHRLLERLLAAGFASELLAPQRRSLLRALPVELQLRVALATGSAATVLQHRDWILRHVGSLPASLCRELATLIDPEQDEQHSEDQASLPPVSLAASADVATSEWIDTPPAERVELFLTLLLRLNHHQCVGDGGDGRFSQRALEEKLHAWAAQYRPPVLLARCVDVGNWRAAASLHEAHGELVDAVECRLHIHRHRRHSLPVPVPVPEEEEATEEDRERELRETVEALLVRRSSAPVATRAAILARLLAAWFEAALPGDALEALLLSPSVFPHVAPPLALLFFGDAGLDERERAWAARCHALPLSGAFLLRVCQWRLAHAETEEATSLARALATLRDNAAKNDLSTAAVRLAPTHAAPALGKSDPLETHVRAFSCGHVFAKRVFEDDVVPEFERRVGALPAPLFATRQLLLAEFRRSGVQAAPCPVCAFKQMSAAVFAAEAGPPLLAEEDQVYYLHGRSALAAAASSSSAQRQHEPWEWRSGQSSATTATTTAAS